MKITGVEDMGDDIAVNIEGHRDVIMPHAAYKLLNEHKADLKAFIESLPTVDAGSEVDDVPEGAPMHFLIAEHPEFDHIWVFFYLNGDSVVVAADAGPVPGFLYTRTTDIEGLVQIIEAAMAMIEK